ncbi:hypothetical protein [Nocardia carnea]|uniref:hypothetical protein n=1 Tax=Nocardia carnea TaxID=37328 RepID=UPI002454A0BF|nr:hypothetical protein [Nocardia carnea]
MAYSQRWGEQRWPEVPPDRTAGPPVRPGRRRPDPDTEPEDNDYAEEPLYEPARPVVNPYAVVALVAALVLLFPVAIVFGLIAFTHPRGRFMAFTAFLLGVLEVAAVVAFVALPRDRVSDLYARVGEALGVTGESAAAGGPAEGPVVNATAVSVPAPPAPSSTPLPPPTTRPGPGSAAPVAEQDTACPEPALIGVAADGATLLCLIDAESVTGYQWSGPRRVAEAVHEEDEECTGGAAATARTSAGLALVCENGAWVLWTS